ncbi:MULTISPECIES: A24 family peptidase [unclassified Vibrio]|uniref:A24 family peptidase n=1 Tax=unclassified Vibrio TaxID=2614977 RepID=UPI002F42CEEE
MDVFIWIVLFAIAVSDAKEHRIPNSLLLVVLFVSFINKAVVLQDYNFLLWSSVSGITCFGVALVFYFLKVMAPGDVKLLGVVGFWLGSGHILGAVYWIAVASVVIGLFYAFLRLAESPNQFKSLLNKYSIYVMYGSSGSKALTSPNGSRGRYQMPFAPVVVVGVALYFYFLN